MIYRLSLRSDDTAYADNQTTRQAIADRLDEAKALILNGDLRADIMDGNTTLGAWTYTPSPPEE